jgi:hypothetical protein
MSSVYDVRIREYPTRRAKQLKKNHSCGRRQMANSTGMSKTSLDDSISTDNHCPVAAYVRMM